MNDNSMTQIIRVEKAAMRILNPDLEYENCLQTYHIPPIEGYIDQQCQNHYQTILLNTTHPLHKNIVLNTNRKTRVSSAVRMPLCRTEKLKKSFFFKYANCQRYSTLLFPFYFCLIYVQLPCCFFDHIYITSVNFYEYFHSRASNYDIWRNK